MATVNWTPTKKGFQTMKDSEAELHARFAAYFNTAAASGDPDKRWERMEAEFDMIYEVMKELAAMHYKRRNWIKSGMDNWSAE